MDFKDETNILIGPNLEVTCRIRKESLGKHFYRCLSSRDPSDVICVDAVTAETLTAGRLLEDSVKVTQIFNKFTIEIGDTIAIISENTLTYSVPLIAAFYMGVTVALLNPSYTKDELRNALTLCKPKLIICTPTCLKNVEEIKQEVDVIKTVLVNSSSHTQHSADNDLNNLIQKVSIDFNTFIPYEFDYSNQPALLLLSSGTTGIPKAVMLTHQNLSAAIGYFNCKKVYNVSRGDTTIGILPYFHVYGTTVLLGAITSGMKNILMAKFVPEIFLKSIQDHKVTNLFLVPTLVFFFTKSEIVDNYNTSSIKHVVIGGERVTVELHLESAKKFCNATVVLGYGMTETSGVCIVGTGDNNKPGSVGVLVPGMTAKVCDTTTEEALGPMQIGELRFKGPIITKGYLDNEKATKELIDKDGFCRSGDVGYYDKDGCVYIIDRIKQLIKYKGFQVSPLEIENIILSHSGIKECCVIGIPDERCGQLPFAFVVPQSKYNILENDLINHVAERISDEKHLRGGIEFVKSIPKTSSGKISRIEALALWKSLHNP